MNSENKTLEIELDQFILWFIKQEHMTSDKCLWGVPGKLHWTSTETKSGTNELKLGAQEPMSCVRIPKIDKKTNKIYGLHPSHLLGSGCERSNPRKKNPFLWALPKLTPPPFYCDLFSKLGYAKDDAQDVSRLLHRFVKIITGSELSLHFQCLGQLCLWQCLRVEFGTG